MEREKLIEEADKFLERKGIDDLVMAVDISGEFIHATELMADFVIKKLNK